MNPYFSLPTTETLQKLSTILVLEYSNSKEYSKRAMKTKAMQVKIHSSIAVNSCAMGIVSDMVLLTLISMSKSVTEINGKLCLNN